MTTYVNVFDPQTMSPVYMEFKRSDTGEWARRDFEKAQVKYQRRTPLMRRRRRLVNLR